MQGGARHGVPEMPPRDVRVRGRVELPALLLLPCRHGDEEEVHVQAGHDLPALRPRLLLPGPRFLLPPVLPLPARLLRLAQVHALKGHGVQPVPERHLRQYLVVAHRVLRVRHVPGAGGGAEVVRGGQERALRAVWIRWVGWLAFSLNN